MSVFKRAFLDLVFNSTIFPAIFFLYLVPPDLFHDPAKPSAEKWLRVLRQPLVRMTEAIRLENLILSFPPVIRPPALDHSGGTTVECAGKGWEWDDLLERYI